jgi:hypothetical protein
MESLKRANLDSASFDDRLRLMSMLDIKVYPSEDLKTVRIKTRLGIDSSQVSDSPNYCGKVLFAPLGVLIGRTPTSVFFPSGGIGKRY